MSKLKLGIAPGGEVAAITAEVCLNKSQKLPAKSGRYLIYSAGYYSPLADAATAISCYTEESLTTSASVYQRVPVVTNINVVPVEMPYADAGAPATLTQAILDVCIGKLMDIYVDVNGIQYAENDQFQSVIRCVGGSVADNVLYTVAADVKISGA